MIPDSQEWVVAEKPTGLVGPFGQKRGHLTPGWQTKSHSQGFSRCLHNWIALFIICLTSTYITLTGHQRLFKCLMNVNSFNPHGNPTPQVLLLSPMHRRENGGTEGLSDSLWS